jgi:hypothetical protein
MNMALILSINSKLAQRYGCPNKAVLHFVNLIHTLLESSIFVYKCTVRVFKFLFIKIQPSDVSLKLCLYLYKTRYVCLIIIDFTY